MSSRTHQRPSRAERRESVLSKFRPGRVGKQVASLISHEETDPDPKAHSTSPTTRYRASVDKSRIDPDTEDYWTEYKANPILYSQIHALIDDVFEAGYWITAESDKTEEEIAEFCENMGIEGGKPHRTLPEVGKQAIVQYKVRGTYLAEKVLDEKGRHIAVNPVNPSTVEVVTKPGVNILVPPDYKPPEGGGGDIKRTEGGEVAAYIQFDSRSSRWKDRQERKFTRNQMLHWARNPDIGDVFGESAIAPIYERSRALREKLQDNDLAIAMKAWPMVMFQLGDPERPWTLDEMEDFMDDYTEEQLGPGMYQGVPGDVNVHEFAGETADISEHVMTDVDMIISGLPGPKHALGSFPVEGDPEAHERQYRKTVRLLRKQLEDLFTPYLQEVAESWGYDSEDLELHIGRPDGEVAPEDIQGSIIRYTSDVDNDDAEDVDVTDDGDSGSDGGSGNDDDGDDDLGMPPDGRLDVAQLADPNSSIDVCTEDLSDPRIVSTSDLESDLQGEIADLLIESRGRTLELLELRFSDRTLPSGTTVAAEFETQVSSAGRGTGFSRSVEDLTDDVYRRTLETIGTDGHAPQINVFPRPEHRSQVSRSAEQILHDVVDLGTEMSREIRRQTDVIGSSDLGIEAVAERVEDVYSDGTLQNRAWIIARMRIQELVNRVKLDEYRRHDDIEGVAVVSSCSSDTHSVTAELAGCDGEQVVARFDDDRTISEQWQEATSADPAQGFDPISDVPPFHFGSSAQLVPVPSDDT